MKSNQILVFTILALGPLLCFGQIGNIKQQLKPNQLESIHNTQRYIIRADGQLIESDATEGGLLIQNSYPKGGSYTNPEGTRFGYGVFWTRMANETAFPIEIAINFPADSFPIVNEAVPTFENMFNFYADSLSTGNRFNKYFKLFLPSDKMTLDKIPSYDYGATGVKFFLDTCLNESTFLKKTIQPQETTLFYVGILLHVPDNGPVRTGIIAKNQHLYYSVSIDRQLDKTLIPCGHIAIKKGE